MELKLLWKNIAYVLVLCILQEVNGQECVGQECLGGDAAITPCSNSYCECNVDYVYELQTCPEGEVFDPVIYHACVDPADVDACSVYGDGYCPEVSCDPESDTTAYDEDACTASYCICTGYWEETACNEGEAFDSETLECLPEDEVAMCAGSTDTTTETITTTEPVTTTTTTETITTTTTEGDVITTAEPARVPDCAGEDCFTGNEAQDTACSNSYCVCGDDFVYVEQTCPDDQIYVFDPIESSCLDPDEVQACSEFGQGYCPEVDCAGGTTEPYYEDECTERYCICSSESGKWEEETCDNGEVYDEDADGCNTEDDVAVCQPTTSTSTTTITTTTTSTTTTTTTSTTTTTTTTTTETTTVTSTTSTTTVTTTTTTFTSTTTVTTTSTTMSTTETSTTEDGGITSTTEGSSTVTTMTSTTTDSTEPSSSTTTTTTIIITTTSTTMTTTTTVATTNCASITNPQCSQEGQFIEYAICSATYCMCNDDGTLTDQHCDVGLVFDDLLGDCEIPEVVSECTNAEDACALNGGEGCPFPGEVEASNWDDGCSSVFCECQDDGGYDVHTCAPGLLYNASKGYCDQTC